MHKVVSHKVYGKDSDPTIYYLIGYRSTIKEFVPHIYALKRHGFRVMAFGYTEEILLSGDPYVLIDALDYIIDIIKRDKKSRQVSGVYGISLGSWLGLNAAIACNINRAVFNTGGVRASTSIWNRPSLREEKAAYQSHGYTHEDLQRIWRGQDNYTEAEIKGKHFIVMASTGDEVLVYPQAAETVHHWQSFNPNIQFIVTKRLKHWQVIVLNLTKLKVTVNFFKAV